VSRLITTIATIDATNPGSTGSIVGTPHAFHANAVPTPRSIAAIAPCLLARRQVTPSTTGAKKLEAISAVNSSTMNWTSSPWPTPESNSTSGTTPVTTTPARAIHTRPRPAARCGASTPAMSCASAEPATISSESTVDIMAAVTAASSSAPRNGGSTARATIGIARSPVASAGKSTIAHSASTKTIRFITVVATIASRMPRRMVGRSRIA
jgi:hypothetical protein